MSRSSKTFWGMIATAVLGITMSSYVLGNFAASEVEAFRKGKPTAFTRFIGVPETAPGKIEIAFQAEIPEEVSACDEMKLRYEKYEELSEEFDQMLETKPYVDPLTLNRYQELEQFVADTNWFISQNNYIKKDIIGEDIIYHSPKNECEQAAHDFRDLYASNLIGYSMNNTYGDLENENRRLARIARENKAKVEAATENIAETVKDNYQSADEATVDAVEENVADEYVTDETEADETNTKTAVGVEATIASSNVTGTQIKETKKSVDDYLREYFKDNNWCCEDYPKDEWGTIVWPYLDDQYSNVDVAYSNVCGS